MRIKLLRLRPLYCRDALGLVTIVISILSLTFSSPNAHAESICYGTPNKGRIEGAVQLPDSGANFSAYSSLAATLGRNYVHSRVRDIVIAAYGAMEKSAPGKVFVYGETGWKSGARFRPHRTHQNGLSIDFFVPVVNVKGESVPLPTSPLNKFGYDIEFDADGKFGDLAIDFEAIGEHLYQLGLASRQAGASIGLVIFDPPYLPRLLATRHGELLQQHIKFMQGRAWVRHDEHYHIDFALPCRPLDNKN